MSSESKPRIPFTRKYQLTEEIILDYLSSCMPLPGFESIHHNGMLRVNETKKANGFAYYQHKTCMLQFQLLLVWFLVHMVTFKMGTSLLAQFLVNILSLIIHDNCESYGLKCVNAFSIYHCKFIITCQPFVFKSFLDSVYDPLANTRTCICKCVGSFGFLSTRLCPIAQLHSDSSKDSSCQSVHTKHAEEGAEYEVLHDEDQTIHGTDL